MLSLYGHKLTFCTPYLRHKPDRLMVELLSELYICRSAFLAKYITIEIYMTPVMVFKPSCQLKECRRPDLVSSNTSNISPGTQLNDV